PALCLERRDPARVRRPALARHRRSGPARARPGRCPRLSPSTNTTSDPQTIRRPRGTILAFATPDTGAPHPDRRSHMGHFVLVHGSWTGGWAFAAVARALRARGHDVYPLTLTGLGERSHLARPEVNLDTHIDDAV